MRSSISFYASPNIIKMLKRRTIELAGHIARTGYIIKTYNILVVEPQGRRPLGRSRRRWEDNIRMGGIIWTEFIWLRLGTSVWLL
jgi:hypothetical protein